MALDPGSVSVSPDGIVSGTGFARDEFDSLLAEVEQKYSDAGQSLPQGAAFAALASGMVIAANAAARVVAYMLANAQLDIANEVLL